MGVGFINIIYKVWFAEAGYFRHYKNLDSLFLVNQKPLLKDDIKSNNPLPRPIYNRGGIPPLA